MLVVDPPSGIEPAITSLAVPMTSALLFTESKAITSVLFGDIASRPGELPAPISPPLTSVSISPSTISRPGNAVGLATLCDARTRVVTLLGGRVTLDPLLPQATRPNATTTIRAGKNTILFGSNFKRQAPNNMKDGDLGAK